jgi:hypothetical protein
MTYDGSGKYIYDEHDIIESLSHSNIGQIRLPHLSEAIHPYPFDQVGIAMSSCTCCAWIASFSLNTVSQCHERLYKPVSADKIRFKGGIHLGHPTTRVLFAQPIHITNQGMHLMVK